MPTILINTNCLSNRKSIQSNSDQLHQDDSNTNSISNNDDFKQEINTIITKLLNKSESMDSFFIKYDLEDLTSSNDKLKSDTNCICFRMARLFNELLNTKEKQTSNNGVSDISSNNSNEKHNPTQQQQHNSTEINRIHHELKLLRRFQYDLSSKFNQILDKFDQVQNTTQKSEHIRPNMNNNSSKQNLLLNTSNNNNNHQQNSHNLSTSSSSLSKMLTGAKKRKFNNSKKGFNTDDCQEINNIQNNNNNNNNNRQSRSRSRSPSHQSTMNNSSPVSTSSTRERSGASSRSSSTSSLSLNNVNKNNHKINSEIVDINNGYINNNNNNNCENDTSSDLQTGSAQPMSSENDNNFYADDQENQENNSNENDESVDCFDNFNNQNSDVVEVLDEDEEEEDEDLQQEEDINNDHHDHTLIASNGNHHHHHNHHGGNHHPYSTSNLYQNQMKRFNVPSISPMQYNLQGNLGAVNPYAHNSYHHTASSANRYANIKPATNARPTASYEQIQNDYKPNLKSSDVKKESSSYGAVNNSYFSGDFKASPSNDAKHSQLIDIDINELFKGDGPKYLQLDSYKDFKPPLVKHNDLYYIEDTLAASAYSKSKSRRNFAAHLTKLVFTPRERLESNCNGRFGKKALDSVRLSAIRNTLFKYYPCKQSTVILNGDRITSGDHDENSVWVRDCIPAIDESNRVLKKQLIAWYKKSNNSTSKLLNSSNELGSINNNSSYAGQHQMGQYQGSSSANEQHMSMSTSSMYTSNQAYQNQSGYNIDEQDFDEFDEHE